MSIDPQTVHPVEYLPRLVTHVEMRAVQHVAGNSQALAGWCGGSVITEGERTAVAIGDQLAYLGDWVLSDGEGYRVEPADGFTQRFWPQGVDPGWPWRCYRDGEAPA